MDFPWVLFVQRWLLVTGLRALDALDREYLDSRKPDRPEPTFRAGLRSGWSKIGAVYTAHESHNTSKILFFPKAQSPRQTRGPQACIGTPPTPPSRHLPPDTSDVTSRPPSQAHTRQHTLSSAMERARHRSPPSSERFLGSFLAPAAAGEQSASTAFELDEDDLFSAGSASPEPPQPVRRPLILSSVRPANPSPAPRLRRPPEGILDALPERRRSPPQSSSSTSPSPASPAAAVPRMIPAVPRPAPVPAPQMARSLPVNVPAARLQKPPKVMGEKTLISPLSPMDEDDEEMLPPHEMVARARARESPMTTFSVLEGAGRTLKGRDLRQVRNAVWRKTGFLD